MAAVMLGVFIVAVLAVVMLMRMPVTILGHIDAFIPAILHEIYGGAAGAITMAVLVPVLYMFRVSMDVHRGGTIRYRLNVHRLAMYQARRRIAADVDVAIKPGLPDAD